METAPYLKAALAGGFWKPDFHKWREGRRGWLVEWDRNPDCNDIRAKAPFICEWASLIIDELIEQQPEIGQAWEKILLAHPVLAPGRGSFQPLTCDEETWLEDTGWKQDQTPFRTCLKLAEPEGNSPFWRLNIILQDKQDHNIVAAWDSGEPGWSDETPPEWRHYGGRIEREIKRWMSVLPWLQDSGGEQPEGAAGLRRELNEEEAWDFLNTGAIQLAQAGHTVFLPRWWEEIKMLVPALKIRTRSSVGSWKESRLGLSQIIQFDWNLAVGGLELSEEEFRQVVEKNGA